MPINEEHIAYVREHLKEFSEQEIRETMLQHGATQDEVDAAFRAVRGDRKRPWKRWLALSGLLAAIGAILGTVWVLRRPEQTGPGPTTLTIQADPVYEGKELGYQVRRPDGFDGLKDRRANGTDTLVMWPKANKVEFQDMGDMRRISSLGIIVVDVAPAEGAASKFEAAVAEIRADLARTGSRVVEEPRTCPAGPCAIFHVETPRFASAVVFGEHNVFSVTSGAIGDALHAVLDSLKEIPQDPEAKFVALRREILAYQLDGKQHPHAVRATQAAAAVLKSESRRYNSWLRQGAAYKSESWLVSLDDLPKVAGLPPGAHVGEVWTIQFDVDNATDQDIQCVVDTRTDSVISCSGK